MSIVKGTSNHYLFQVVAHTNFPNLVPSSCTDLPKVLKKRMLLVKFSERSGKPDCVKRKHGVLRAGLKCEKSGLSLVEIWN